MKYVEEWKQNEVEKTYEDYKRWLDKLEQLKKDWKNGVKNGFNILQSHRYSNKYYNSLSYCSDEERIINCIKVAVDEHFKMLQAKVEKKIGKIINITNVNGNTYWFKGELDECYTEVILAGGYNIQRLHTRWLIKKEVR